MTARHDPPQGTDRAKRALISLADHAGSHRTARLIDGVADTVRTHPVASLAGAAGLGIVLARYRFSRRLLSVAAMHAARTVLRENQSASH